MNVAFALALGLVTAPPAAERDQARVRNIVRSGTDPGAWLTQTWRRGPAGGSPGGSSGKCSCRATDDRPTREQVVRVSPDRRDRVPLVYDVQLRHRCP